jgi:hypothetical protein
MHRHLISKHALGVFLAAVAACQPSEPGADVTLTFGRVPRELGAPCSAAASSTAEFQSELDNLRLKVSGPGMKSMEKTYSTGGELVMDKVPVGENRRVLVSGLRSTLVLWRGVSRGVKVDANTASDVSVLLTRVADMTCARNAMQVPRSFHTATPLKDGRILLLGGVTQETNGTNCVPTGGICRNLVATNTADIFDPTTGDFTSTQGVMAAPRAFHTATLMEDGKVLIVGGASAAQVNGAAPFPILPAQAVTDIELFDPSSGLFEAVGTDVARTFGSAVLVKAGTYAGAVLVTGGGAPLLWDVPLPMDVRANTSKALRATLLCTSGSGTVTCQPGPEMQARRVGHTMSELSDGRILVVGGSIETGSVSGVSKQGPEFFNGDAFIWPTDAPVLDADTRNNQFFGNAMKVAGYNGVFLVGGLTRQDDTSSLRLKAPEAQVWFYAEDGNFMAIGADAGNWELSVPRYLAGAAPLGDGSNWAVAGGFRGELSAFDPADTLEIFDGTRSIFKTISVGGVPRTLRQARGGVPAVGLASGTALFPGGTTLTMGGTVAPLETAEIFTDTTEPP